MLGAQALSASLSSITALKDLRLSSSFLLAIIVISSALVFYGLLGASSVAAHTVPTDEVKALNQENVAGPVEIEFLADCQRTEKPLKAFFNRPCQD